MLSLSVTTGYAIKALTCLESGDCVPRHISDIAQCTGVPRAYLAKILSALAQQGLVQSKRGYRGGISLVRPAEDISLLQIVEAVEGDRWLGECLLGMDACDILTTCPTHNFWARIRGEITEELAKTTLAAVIRAWNPVTMGNAGSMTAEQPNPREPVNTSRSTNINKSMSTNNIMKTCNPTKTRHSQETKQPLVLRKLAFGLAVMACLSAPNLQAYPDSATGTANSCSVCHGTAGGGRTVTGLLAISGTTKLTDLGKQLGGQTRGPLKTFDALPGTTVELSVDVLPTTNLIGTASYALQFKRLEMSGQQLSTNNFLSWTDANPGGSGWVIQDDPAVPAGVTNPYFTKDLTANQTGTFKFLLGLNPQTPVDVYDLEFAIAGQDGGGLIYYDRHFYLAVIAPELLTDQAVTWSQALSAAGYVLQVADSPDGPWQNYTGGMAVIDGSNVALMHVSGGSKKFFRLYKP